MKRSRGESRVRPLLAVGFALVVISAVITGVLLLDPPAQEQLRRLDERRVFDLRGLAYAVDAHWTREGVLPSSLDELSEDEQMRRQGVDPVTGEPYEYREIDGSHYELCAVFALETASGNRAGLPKEPWFHGPGRQCFRLQAQNVGRIVDR